ncbi:GTPase activator, putative [Theileria annulata]|uniref:GTPase activator, putative n=1 Tax=Theileria annulata TaxID=5874 RepID=Q4UF50_THEAN|nr:GTPase activator, putative [Theileria annulata]CAI74289.1 GTPase activator, putative [Theileria annulata]|eukprot:XP_952021.1 GTPase activator, putative [Theileria annulata]
MSGKDVEIIQKCDELTPPNSSRSQNPERLRRGLFPFKRVQTEDDTSWFDIFGFGSRRFLNNNLSYGLTLALPQCDCRRLSANPITFNVEQAIKDNPNFKKLPKQVKGERCSRFNQWWLKCCQSAVLKQQGVYWNLIQLLGAKVVVNSKETSVSELVLGRRITLAIEMDIKRTYPSLRFFTRYGRSMMRRILLAYAFFDTEVGYVQGLNFIVANLLWHSSEEQAFWALISMMYLYDLRCMFLPGLPGVFKRCEILEHCMIKYIPKLHDHLKSVGVHIPMIASDWFMTLCANSIPIKALVLSLPGLLWDCFFSEGWIAIFRFILYRLKQFEDYLVTMSDIADIMKVIKYGNASLTEKWRLMELIPGFGGVNRRRIELINAAYSTNVDNLTNDPNKNSNDCDWLAIVEASLLCNFESNFIEDLELTNSEIMYHDLPVITNQVANKFGNNGVLAGKSSELSDLDEAMKSCVSSENSIYLSEDESYNKLNTTNISSSTNAETVISEDNVPNSPNNVDDAENMKLVEHLSKDSGIPMLSDSIKILYENSLGDIAQDLEKLAISFRSQLDAIGVSKAYHLHLKALQDELPNKLFHT